MLGVVLAVVDSSFLQFVLVMWAIVGVRDLRDLWMHHYGWIAKIEDGYLYMDKKNAIPLNSINSIRRQEVMGNKHGIDIIYHNGHVQSINVPVLNDAQLNDLVEFLNAKQI